MDGFHHWKMRLLATIGLVLLGAGNARAEEVVPNSTNAKAWDTIVERLCSDWEEVREGLTQCAVEATMTMFFIKPPSIPPGDVPPQGELPPPPPPPEGNGEDPPRDPPDDPPPPSEAPEPVSMVSALLGVGLISAIAWRKRRKRPEPDA